MTATGVIPDIVLVVFFIYTSFNSLTDPVDIINVNEKRNIPNFNICNNG